MIDEVGFIFKIAEEETGVGPEKIQSKSRKRGVVNVRRMISVILEKNTKMKLDNIGGYLGGRDHATIIHYRNTHEDLMNQEYNFRKTFVKIESRFLKDRNTVETRLEMKLNERENINKEIVRLRKLLKIKNS